MKAMILAAGLGTRLKPLTDKLPKALIPVADEPILQIVIEHLKAAGFTHIVVNIHHLGEQIIDFLEANNNFGIDIQVSDEREELLDTGGALLHASPLLKGMDNLEGVLIHNVDILSNCNLKDLYMLHNSEQRYAHATMLVSQRNSSRKLLFDDNNHLCGWINKNSGETKPQNLEYKEGKYKEYSYSGIQMISPAMISLMKAYDYKGKFSIIDFYMDMLDKEELNVYGYVDSNLKLLDIGKPETLIEANKFVKELRCI